MGSQSYFVVCLLTVFNSISSELCIQLEKLSGTAFPGWYRFKAQKGSRFERKTIEITLKV